MPLAPGRLPFFRYDGSHIFFSMETFGRHVPCAVSVEFLVERAYRDKALMESYADLFDRYRSEIESIASQQYDDGVAAPVVTLGDSYKSMFLKAMLLAATR